MLRTLRRVPSVARIAFASPRSAVRVSMVRLPLSALPTPQGSSTEEWSLIVALCRPRQGRQKANFCTALGGLRRLLFSLFYRRATWSVGRPGAAFSTPMSVALRWRFPRRRPPCPCCKFTSSTAISTELAINAWWISLHVPPWYPPRYCQTLRHRYQTIFEQRLSAAWSDVGRQEVADQNQPRGLTYHRLGVRRPPLESRPPSEPFSPPD